MTPDPTSKPEDDERGAEAPTGKRAADERVAPASDGPSLTAPTPSEPQERDAKVRAVEQLLGAEGTAYERWVTWGYPGEDNWENPRGRCDLRAIAGMIVDLLDTPSEPLSGSGEEQWTTACPKCMGDGGGDWGTCKFCEGRGRIEVVPASLAARYKAEAEEARAELAKAWITDPQFIRDLHDARRAAEQARDKAHALLNKALPFIPEPHPRRDSESGPCLRDRILAALSPPTEETSE